jgi:hypothetical protein
MKFQKSMIITGIAIIIQNLLLFVLLFGDIGFDVPGRFGLDIEHGVVIFVLYIGFLLFGVIRSVFKKEWKFLISQIVVPLVVVAFLILPSPGLDAKKYQYLVGKTVAEVERERIKNRIFISEENVNGIIIKEQTYKGMTIVFSVDGIVIKVISNEN